MNSASSIVLPFTAVWLLAGTNIAWPIELERVERHLVGLTDSIAANLHATYRYEDALLDWRLEQMFRRGNAPCSGQTSQHEVVQPRAAGAENLWDRYVSRQFAFSDVRMIVVKPGPRPLLYTLPGKPATLEPRESAAYTVTISTGGGDFQIEFYGFDGGDNIAKEAPLHFTSYYHDIFVSSHSKALDAAAHLKALGEECGAGLVEVHDLGR